MIQSCLRVSYTSPKIMHWITKGLIYLYSTNKYADLDSFLENLAIESIKNSCFENSKISEYSKCNMGVNTPHILFNYLDYLI